MPCRRQRRCAFTLVEVMIVVMIMAIMAAVVIPQVSAAMDDAKESAMLANLQTLTRAIELYKINHHGRPPDDLTGDTLSQLTSATNEFGELGKGPGYPYGPYLMGDFPENPLNGVATVYVAQVTPPTNLEKINGWVYDRRTGQIWGGLRR